MLLPLHLYYTMHIEITLYSLAQKEAILMKYFSSSFEKLVRTMEQQ